MQGRRSEVIALLAAVLCTGGVWYVAHGQGTLLDAHAESARLLAAVLRRLTEMSFSEVVQTQSGRRVTVTTTCDTGETIEDCWARHQEAVQLVLGSS